MPRDPAAQSSFREKHPGQRAAGRSAGGDQGRMQRRSADTATAWRPDRAQALRGPAGRGLGGILIALLLLGCNETETAAPAATPAAAPTVIVAPVERQAVAQSVEFVGRVEALEKVDIR